MQIIDIFSIHMKRWINLHHFLYHHCKNSMQIHRVPANTASKVGVIHIFRFKIQRVQKTQLSLCNCIYNTNNRHIQYIYIYIWIHRIIHILFYIVSSYHRSDQINCSIYQYMYFLITCNTQCKLSILLVYKWTKLNELHHVMYQP